MENEIIERLEKRIKRLEIRLDRLESKNPKSDVANLTDNDIEFEEFSSEDENNLNKL